MAVPQSSTIGRNSGPFRQYGQALINNGYELVPIPIGRKGPVIADWQSDPINTSARFAQVVQDHARDGVGILTRKTPAIDIDCFDQVIVDALIVWCEDNIGRAPVRVGNAPKTLLMYRTDEAFPKVTSARYYDPTNPSVDPKKKGQRLEVLGDGQQFVAYHIHPDTNRPYDWINDWEEPVEIPAADLPVLTAEHARLAAREFERLCEEAGWVKLGDGSATEAANGSEDYDPLAEILPPEETDDEVARVRSALDAISGEVASTYDYDQWRNVLFALKWTRWDCAEGLARQWSESSDKHVGREFNVVWKGAQKRDRGREITLGSLFKLAKDAGWAPTTGMTEEEVKVAFANIKELIQELRDLDNTHAETAKLIAQIAAVPMSSMQEGELLRDIKSLTGATIADLRRDLARARKAHAKEESFMATHAGYAANIISQLEEKGGVRPVGVEGSIWWYSESKGIWKGMNTVDFAVEVAKKFDGQENCSRRNDYTAIASHAYSVVAEGNEGFFSDAPIGLACKGRFYKVGSDGKIEREELDHTHRQRVLSDVVPAVGPMPKFQQYLTDTFDGDPDDEQVELLQEVMGSVMLGSLAKYEKVVMLKGPGRSGKGTIMKIMTALVPEDGQTAVSPYNWDSEYYLAALAGKRLNLVGELPDDEPIPAAHFKTVTGRDKLTGRHPSHRPFTFINGCAHIFNSNHFVYTKDHSEAFYTRWLLMEFRNSRIGRESEQNHTLAKEIVEEELPAIMAWALQGAKRLEERGYFKTTKIHLKLMNQWRHRTSTLLEFLLDTEVCTLGSDSRYQCRRSDFYRTYSDWCKDSNRRPMGKIKLFDELDAVGHSVGVAQGTLGGVHVIRGVSLDGESWVAEDDDW